MIYLEPDCNFCIFVKIKHEFQNFCKIIKQPNMIASYFSSPVTLNKISFALGWILVIAMASWPGSLAIQITMVILAILFVASAMLCFMAHRKLSALFNDISQNQLLNSLLWLAWLAGFICAGFSSPVVKESVCNAATVILIIGLLFYPSPSSSDKPKLD